MTTRRRRFIAGLLCALVPFGGSHAQTPPTPAGTAVVIGYLRDTAPRAALSPRDKPAADDGLAGAQLGTSDDDTTGRFVGLHVALVEVPWSDDADPARLLDDLARQGAGVVLADMAADALLRVADAASPRHMTILNVGATDDRLRGADCRDNILHVAPSRAMLADAVAQYLVWKRWSRWVLVYGSHPDDALLAEAYRRAARRFGARIVADKLFPDTGGARQSDSGIVQIQQELPVFTQDLPDYDVLVAADDSAVFADDLPYRTWQARPVAGSAGLRPVTWDPASQGWGGAQMQSRFTRRFHRDMSARDMQAWTAVRMIGEAATRARGSGSANLVEYLKSTEFAVGAYKGQNLSLRDWDWQLRQPILLSDGRMVISVSPQPGFLHQSSALDTLGVDRPETQCRK